MAPPTFDVPVAERWFAAAANNFAWDLVEAARRSADETERMLHAAHAACHHWRQVGQPVHHLRALVLLATAYSTAARTAEAARYAEQALALLAAPDVAATDWDRATAWGSAAMAFAAVGRSDAARELDGRAHALATTFDDDADRELFHRLYPPRG